jgi:hypothetical protein
VATLRLNGQTSGFVEIEAASVAANNTITLPSESGSIIVQGTTGITSFTNAPVVIGSGTSTGTASQALQVTGGAYVSGSVGIGTTNPSTALSVSGNANITGIATAETLVASKVASTNPLAYTNSTFGNGWSVIAPVSTTYYKLATLPASTAATFDDMVIEGIIGGFASVDKQPFKIHFANRNGFTYKYDSYGTVQNLARIIGISTNNTVEIWAQHSASLFTTLTYSISSSIQVNVVSNPTPTTTAPVGTTVFDSSSATYKPRFSIDNSGRVTMPFQPSFYAYNTTGNNITNGNIIDFGTTLSNVGSHYSTSTSRFTAPVAGSYYFYAQLLSEDSTVTTDFRFYVNGGVRNGGYSGLGTWTNGNGYKTATGATVLLLAANDIVDVRSAGTSSIHQDAAHTYWLGYLLG